MDGTLRLDRVQGNIALRLERATRPSSASSFASAMIARQWFAELVIEVASAAQVMPARQKRRESGYAAGDVGGPPTTWVNVTSSRARLERLGAGGGTPVSVPFQSDLSMTGGGYSFSPSIPALSHLVQPHGYVGRKESSNGLHSR